MPNCHDMKKGRIYYCDDCGLELQVVKECKNADTPVEECECCKENDPGTFSCCGMELKKK
jgi:predicted nucleic acid-binding Zn ribbon protein